MSSSGQNLLENPELAPAKIAAGPEDASAEATCEEQTGEDMVAHWNWVDPPIVALGVGLQDFGSSWAIALVQMLAKFHVLDLGAHVPEHLVGILEHLVDSGLSGLPGPLVAEALEPKALEALEA